MQSGMINDMRKYLIGVLLLIGIIIPFTFSSVSAETLSNEEIDTLLDSLIKSDAFSSVNQPTVPSGPAPAINRPTPIDYSDPEIFNNLLLQSGLDPSSLSSPMSPSVEISLQPPHPQPGESVTASINDYSSQFFGASIIWFIDGVEQTNVRNQRKVTFTAAREGVAQDITVTLLTANGLEQVFNKTVTPTYLDIILEPQTRTPDFFRGRALPSIGATVNATALVSGRPFNDPNLVYVWRINREVLEQGPIRGRNQVAFQVPWGDDAVLSVEVSDMRGEVIASRSILLPVTRPELYFYEANPLYGVDPITISTNQLFSNNSVTLRAEPYYLDINVFNNGDINEWSVNQNVIQYKSGDPYEITLQRSDGTGFSQIGFHVRSTEQLLQGVKDDIQIRF